MSTFVVAHLSESVGLDVLLRTDEAPIAVREVECSGPTAHAVYFGALGAVNAACPLDARALINAALADGTHPALHPPVGTPSTESDPATAPTLPPPPEPPPAPTAKPVPPAISPAPKPARALPKRTAPVAAKLPAISPAEPTAPSPPAVDLCPRCGVAPVRVEASGERGLWCDPCRDAVVRKLVGKRGGR